MTIRQPSALWDEITDFFASAPSEERIIAFRLSETLEARALELLERSHNHLLTPDEQVEMAEFLRVNHFVNLLKLKTRLRLAGKR